ncbi:MAG: hypothetical protein RMK74_06680 [Myxococcales bacterium]|nr:hypothetical protein [Myxococcales bacterium]
MWPMLAFGVAVVGSWLIGSLFDDSESEEVVRVQTFRFDRSNLEQQRRNAEKRAAEIAKAATDKTRHDLSKVRVALDDVLDQMTSAMREQREAIERIIERLDRGRSEAWRAS